MSFDYLQVLEGIKKELSIKNDEEFCDILINPQNHDEKINEWGSDREKEKSLNTVLTLHEAVNYTFQKRGIVTPHDQSIFADMRQVPEDEISKGVYPALSHLGLVRKDGNNYRLTDKAYFSVKK